MPAALEAIPEVSQPLVVVLGMHRSGTSCLAGMLQESGVYLGDVHTQNPHNARGNREHPAVMRINDALLHSVDARWDAPPESNPIRWPGSLQAECLQFLKHHLQAAASRTAGLKDPRLLLTMSAWEFDQLPVPVRFVATIRHPMAVACSLQARNRMPIATGLELWESYNRRLLDHVTRVHCPIVNFDASPEEYHQRFNAIADHLALDSACVSAGKRFYDSALRHHRLKEPEELPKRIASIYRELLTLSSC